MTRIRDGSAISARDATSYRREHSVVLDQWIGLAVGLGGDHIRRFTGMLRVRALRHGAHSSKFFARTKPGLRHTVVAHNEFAPMNERDNETRRRYAPAGNWRTARLDRNAPNASAI